MKFGDNFEITTYDPIDTRLVLTKEEMRNIIGDDDPDTTPGDHYMPDKYFALCKDDNCMYYFDYEATPNDETGKFRKMTAENAEGATAPSAKSGTSAEMASALSTAAEGDLFYNTDDGKLYVAQGDPLAWVEKDPAPGEMIFNQATEKIMYYDGTEWKEVGSGSGEPGKTPSSESGNTAAMISALSTAEKGDLFYNTDDHKLYVADGDPLTWVEKEPEKGQLIYDADLKCIRVFDGTE